jgi:formate C-acetyltransferase
MPDHWMSRPVELLENRLMTAIVDRIHAELLPSPFLSLVVKDCLARGVDVTAGGARYNFSGVQGVQVANVADSLAAVKQAVFDDDWLTAEQLLEALRCDFAGLEPLRQRLINRAPKFGNDDDRADAFAARWADRYSELVASYPTVRGVYQPASHGLAHVPMAPVARPRTAVKRASRWLTGGSRLRRGVTGAAPRRCCAPWARLTSRWHRTARCSI